MQSHVIVTVERVVDDKRFTIKFTLTDQTLDSFNPDDTQLMLGSLLRSAIMEVREGAKDALH